MIQLINKAKMNIFYIKIIKIEIEKTVFLSNFMNPVVKIQTSFDFLRLLIFFFETVFIILKPVPKHIFFFRFSLNPFFSKPVSL